MTAHDHDHGLAPPQPIQDVSRQEHRMIRRLYQIALVALQAALLVEIVPPLAQALWRDVALGTFADSALALAQFASAAAAIAGGALALAFPSFALLRHRQRGRLRFAGMPRWSVALALAGAVVFLLGALLNGVVPLLEPSDGIAVMLTARPVLNAGLALMAAGVLCGEVLRRGVAPPHVAITRHAASARIEVTHPPELATRFA
jgi:hypothetical protein